MTRKQKKDIRIRIESYELRINALRSIPGPIDPKDFEAEAYLQGEVNKMRQQLKAAQ